MARTILARVGQAVRCYRRVKGWSQEELADRSGLHRTYIGGVERGERNLTILSLARIAGALGVEPAVLIREAERNREQ